MQNAPRKSIRTSFLYPAALTLCLLATGLVHPQPARGGGRIVLPQSGQFLSFHELDDGAMQLGFPLPKPRFTYNVQPEYDTGGYGAHCMKKDTQGNPVIEQGVAGNGICDGPEICDGTVTDNLTGLIWLYDPACVTTSPIPGYVEFQSFPQALDSAARLRSGTDKCNHPHPAMKAASGLLDHSVAGDWRIPSIRELRSLANAAWYEAVISDWQGTGQGFAGNPFSDNLVDEKTWSSTTYARDPEKAWYLNAQNGNVASDNKRIAHQVFPVRGPKKLSRAILIPQSGQKKCYNPLGDKYPENEMWRYPDNPLNQIPCTQAPENAGNPYYNPAGQDGLMRQGFAWDAATRFTDNGDGTVTDNLTGLIWTKRAHWNVSMGGVPWLRAMDMVRQIGSGTTEGFNLRDGSRPGDWRLPNVIELWSLIDFNEYGQNYYGDHGVCYGGCEGEALPAGHPFIIEDDPRMGWFWTNTAYAGHVNEENAQIDKGKYMVKPLGGAIVSSAADILGWVWPVRGKSYVPSVAPWLNLLLKESGATP